MVTVAQIRAGLAARLDTIEGFRGFATYPGQISPPVGIVRRRRTLYAQTMDAAAVNDQTMSILVLVSLASDRAAQEAFDAYASPTGSKSIPAAVHADRTLGGIVDYAEVISCEGDGLLEYAGVEYFGGEFVVEVSD